MTKLKVTVFFEAFIGKANGVYTAVLEAVDALKKRETVSLSLNENQKEANVIHAHSIGLGYLLLSLKYRKKLVVSAHVVPDSFIGSLILSEWWRPIAKWYLKMVFNRARLVIAVSPVVKEELEKINVTTPIHVLCNSVDREKFKPNPEARQRVREKLGLPEDAFVVTCVGQIQPRKGIYDFLEAAKLCPDIHFVWVGGRPYGRLTADFDRLTEACDNASDNVHFAGIVPFVEMPDYYAASDVYFLPSIQENFAFATIEASSVKLPLLLRDNVEYPGSLFTHYLKGTNAEEFAGELQKLHKDTDYFAQWQEESNTLANKYEINTYTDKLIELYKSVASPT